MQIEIKSTQEMNKEQRKKMNKGNEEVIKAAWLQHHFTKFRDTSFFSFQIN